MNLNGDSKNLIALLALLVFGLVVYRSLMRSDTNPGSRINLEDLLLGDDGRASKVAFAFWVALAVTTWLMIFLAYRDKMSEGYFLAYGGMWVFPLVAKLVFNQATIPQFQAPSSVTTTTKTEVTPGSKPPDPKPPEGD